MPFPICSVDDDTTSASPLVRIARCSLSLSEAFHFINIDCIALCPSVLAFEAFGRHFREYTREQKIRDLATTAQGSRKLVVVEVKFSPIAGEFFWLFVDAASARFRSRTNHYGRQCVEDFANK